MHDVHARADVPARSPLPRVPRSWPLLLLAAPAVVAVWSGWVGIGQMTGFGIVRPLPGICDSLHVDTAVTLPLGVEAYAAFALRARLASGASVSDRTRRFARRSAVGSLALGMTGQVAYHLLVQSRSARAPWEITTLVSCLPVLALAMGAALWHLLHADAAAVACVGSPGPAGSAVSSADPDQNSDQSARAYQGGLVQDQAVVRDQITASVLPPGPGRVRVEADQDSDEDDRVIKPLARPAGGQGPAGQRPQATTEECQAPSDRQHDTWSGPDQVLNPGGSGTDRAAKGRGTRTGYPAARVRMAQAAAAELVASGRDVSRRNLRGAGVRGSNAELGAMARTLKPATGAD